MSKLWLQKSSWKGSIFVPVVQYQLLGEAEGVETNHRCKGQRKGAIVTVQLASKSGDACYSSQTRKK